MNGLDILKRIGYNNSSITKTEEWIAKEVYALACKDAEALNKTAIDIFECLECMDTGVLYDAQGKRAGTCPCHY